jgi:TP901 family phage tail tape measure protein
MKAFGDETDTFATHAVDAINNVSNNMAVSSSNISTALSKTSSAMGALGNSYEETIALVTAGSEIMQGQSSKVARGLRTVGNNISNLAQNQRTLAIETQNGTKQIELFDEATGDMKSTYQILEQIASYWDEMNNAQKQAIGIALAGGRIGLACNSLKYGKDGVTTITVLYNYNMVA